MNQREKGGRNIKYGIIITISALFFSPFLFERAADYRGTPTSVRFEPVLGPWNAAALLIAGQGFIVLMIGVGQRNSWFESDIDAHDHIQGVLILLGILVIVYVIWIYI